MSRPISSTSAVASAVVAEATAAAAAEVARSAPTVAARAVASEREAARAQAARRSYGDKRPAPAREEQSRRQKLENVVGVLIHTAKNWFGEGSINPRINHWTLDTRMPFIQGDGEELNEEEVEEFRDLFDQFSLSYSRIMNFVKVHNLQ